MKVYENSPLSEQVSLALKLFYGPMSCLEDYTNNVLPNCLIKMYLNPPSGSGIITNMLKNPELKVKLACGLE